MRLIAKFDGKELGYAEKSFRDLTHNWDKLQKRTTGGLFSFSKDKRKVRDLNNYFGKLKTTLAESMASYKKELQDLEGDGHGGKGTKLFEAQQGLELAKKNLEDVKKQYEEINKQREKLEKRQEKLGFMPSEKQLLKNITSAQARLEQRQTQLSDARQNTINNKKNKETLKSTMDDAVNQFDIAAQMAAAMKFQFGKTKNTEVDANSAWNDLQYKVTGMEKANITQRELLENDLADLKTKETELNEALIEAMDNFKLTHRTKWSDLANSLTMDLDDVRQRITETEDEILANDKSKVFADRFRKALNKAEKTKGEAYKDYNRKNNYSDAEQLSQLMKDFKGKNVLSGKHETAYWNKFKTMTSESSIQVLENQVATLQNEIKSLQSQQTLARQHDNEKVDINTKLENTKTDIKSIDKDTKKAEAAVREWEQSLQVVKDRIEEIKADMELLSGDTKGNPFDYKFASMAMEPMNKETDKLQRKWGALGSVGNKFKAKLAGIHGYMKTITPLTKLWHKVILNIYSQIATLINPLNVFKRAWSDWINRYDNLAWKNTFDVIKYNLVNIIAPFLEWCATMLLKLAAIANVFTKKWFGVDLFDKSAWETEQMKKNLASCTLSIDELHSVDDNPDTFNTVFDKFIDADSLISDDFKKKLEGIADWLKNIFGKVFDFIKKNWKKLLMLWAAFKIGKGLWDLFKLFGGLGSNILGLPSIFKKALGVMSIIAGTALVTLSQIGTVKLAKEWDQMSKDERWKQAGINIGEGIAGGALIGAGIGGLLGGPGGALIGAGIGAAIGGVVTGFEQLAIAAYNGSEAATVAAGALGGAGLGAAIGSVIPGVGTLAGALIGLSVGALAGVTANAFRCSGEFNKLKISEDDVRWATEQVDKASENYNKSLDTLAEAERKAGEKGEWLYELVQRGARSYDSLTDSQKEVYNAYVASKNALTELNKTQETEFTYTTRRMLDNAKSADSFEDYIARVKKGADDGIISQKTMTDQFAQSYAELDNVQRKIFLKQLPENLRESVKEQSEQYISGWEKFRRGIGEYFDELGKHFGNSLSEGIGFVVAGIPGLIMGKLLPLGDLIEGQKNDLAELKATTDDLEQSTKKLNEAQDEQARITEELDELEKKTKVDGEKLYEQVENGTKSWFELSEAEKEVYNKYYELQQAMADTDEAAKKNVDNLLSIDLQAGQTSGDYTRFINDLTTANEKGYISTEEMQKKFSQAYATMDKNSRETFLQNIPENMREGVKKGAADFMQGFEGFMSRLGNKLSEIGNWFKKFGQNAFDFGESLWNAITGNGFRTNKQVQEAKYSNSEWVNNAYSQALKKIKSYDVGSNYIPNDQLAYIHKGEAIIPAKYNKPYSSGNTYSQQTNEEIRQLVNQVRDMQQLISQGIKVQGQFVQRGSDLVATVERASNKVSNNILSQKQYAR